VKGNYGMGGHVTGEHCSLHLSALFTHTHTPNIMVTKRAEEVRKRKVFSQTSN
jgi:hypothetical protein